MRPLRPNACHGSRIPQEHNRRRGGPPKQHAQVALLPALQQELMSEGVPELMDKDIRNASFTSATLHHQVDSTPMKRPIRPYPESITIEVRPLLPLLQISMKRRRYDL